MEPLAQEKGLAFRVTAVTIATETAKLRQISSPRSRTVKFAEGREVRVNLRPRRPELRIEVTPTEGTLPTPPHSMAGHEPPECVFCSRWQLHGQDFRHPLALVFRSDLSDALQSDLHREAIEQRLSQGISRPRRSACKLDPNG